MFLEIDVGGWSKIFESRNRKFPALKFYFVLETSYRMGRNLRCKCRFTWIGRLFREMSANSIFSKLPGPGVNRKLCELFSSANICSVSGGKLGKNEN